MRVIETIFPECWEYWTACVSRWFQSHFFFSGLQYSRDRTLPTVWPNMLSYLHTASNPQFGRAEYPQICVLCCEVRSVSISFSSLQWLMMAAKVNFSFHISVGDIHISEVLVNFIYASGYPRRAVAKIKQILFLDPVKSSIYDLQEQM